MEKTIMKRLSVLLITLLALCLTLLLASCGEPPVIEFKKSAMPQTTFVLGEEIDLTGGVLLIHDGDETLEIDMISELVTVSGYDKNTLGKQTVTLTFDGEASIDLEVTVVERMQALDYNKDYLLGGELDLTKGRLKITRNDGSNFTVALNSPKVSVTGFDSSNAGEKTLTAKYTSNTEEYTANFKVTIHEIETVTLTNPTKIAYKSHDEGIDVTGGFLVYKGMGGKLERSVAVSADMTSGFDLSAVNAQNTPLTQTVNVNYDNRSFSYEIKITYTSISDFKDHASLVKDLDFSGEEAPEITDAQGAEAVRIMELYLDMSQADKARIDADESINVLNVARTALLYAFEQWSTDMLTFSDVFGVEYGSLVFYCKSEQAIISAMEELANKDRPIYQYSDILAALVETYEQETVYGEEMYFFQYPVIDKELYTELIPMFEYMLDLDALMDEIPENWRELDLSDYAQDIEAIFDFIVNGDYYNYSYTTIFYLVSAFREKDDAFDFLYTYYYGLLSSEDEDISSKGLSGIMSIANVRLPAELEEIFSYILMAMEQIEIISDYYNNLLYQEVTDTTQLFYAYHMAQNLMWELLDKLENLPEGEQLSPEDEMILTLFYYLPLNGMLGVSADQGNYYFLDMIEYLRTVEGGYYYYAGALLGVPTYEALMEQYIHILTLLNTDETYDGSDAFGADVEQLMALFMALESSEKFNFLGSLNVFFSQMNIPPLAFDTAPGSPYENYETTFVYLLRSHYQSLFSTEEAKNAYVDLMIAVELFTQRYTNTEWESAFAQKLASARAAFNGLATLNAQDYALFTEKLLPILTQHEALAERFEEEQKPADQIDFKGWREKFDELYTAMIGVELSYQLISENLPYYSLFLSAFERVNALVDDILKNAPPEVIEIYLYESLYSNKELDKFFDENYVEDPATTVYLSFEYMVGLYRSIYVTLLNSTILGSSIYDYYYDHNLNTFMNLAYDIMWDYLLSGEDDTDIFNKADGLAALEAFHALDAQTQILFLMYMEGMSSGMDSYFLTAAEAFYNEEFTASAAKVANAMLSLDMAYMVYDYLGDAESLAALESEYEALVDLYEDLAGNAADKESFADLETIYATLIERVEKALTQDETPAI